MSSARSQVLVVVLASSGCFSPSGIDGSATSSETSAATTGTTSAPDTTHASATSTSTGDAPTGTVTSIGTTETTSTSTTEPVTSTEPVTTTGPSSSTTSDETTGPAVCGDGMVEAPIEQCDDGNQVEGDGCDALCQVELPNKQKRFVFLTSASYPGSEVNKLDNADALCTSLASKSPVPGLQMRKFKAWLSDGSTHAIDRIGSYEGEYVLVDGTVLASGSQAFKVAALKATINVTETGAQIPWLMADCNSSADGVWTGTQADGTVASETCNNWTSDRGTGMIGAFGVTDGKWTGCSSRSCAEPFRLYCIEVE